MLDKTMQIFWKCGEYTGEYFFITGYLTCITDCWNESKILGGGVLGVGGSEKFCTPLWGSMKNNTYTFISVL